MGMGNKLADLIAERKTNVNAVAKKAGVPPTTIYSLIRRDANKVEIDALIKICHALGVTADYFLSEDVYSDIRANEIATIAAHHDEEEWTEEELNEIEEFKKFVLSKRNK